MKRIQTLFLCLIASFLLCGFARPVQAQSTITIGQSAVLPDGDNGNGNLLLAQSATLSQTATITSLSFYVTSAGGNLILGIYDASGPSGGPGALIAQTSSFTPVTGWNTANVITQVSLSPGIYWLAYLPSSNSLNFVKTNDSGNCELYSYKFGSLPTTFSTSAGDCTPTTWSLYATLVPSSGGGGTAPTITTQPQNQTVTVGSTATFSVVASGTAPLSYQWSKNGTAISGATNSSYTTPATVSADNGATFTVTVSNSAGSKTSNAATLTVNAAAVAPTITTQPQNQTVTVGSTATFSVVASGTEIGRAHV